MNSFCSGLLLKLVRLNTQSIFLKQLFHQSKKTKHHQHQNKMDKFLKTKFLTPIERTPTVEEEIRYAKMIRKMIKQDAGLNYFDWLKIFDSTRFELNSIRYGFMGVPYATYTGKISDGWFFHKHYEICVPLKIDSCATKWASFEQLHKYECLELFDNGSDLIYNPITPLNTCTLPTIVYTKNGVRFSRV